MLKKYGIDSNGTDTIPLFSLQTHEIKESDKHFEHCMAEILVRLKNYGSLVVDSLEAMRNEYVVAILHTAINITRDSTGEELSMRPEYEVIGDESAGRVDFAIKVLGQFFPGPLGLANFLAFFFLDQRGDTNTIFFRSRKLRILFVSLRTNQSEI